MDDFGQVVGDLDARFPGEFKCLEDLPGVLRHLEVVSDPGLGEGVPLLIADNSSNCSEIVRLWWLRLLRRKRRSGIRRDLFPLRHSGRGKSLCTDYSVGCPTR